MEFVVLAFAVFVVSFVLPIFLLFRSQKMKDQIAELERNIQDLQGGAPVAPKAVQSPVAKSAQPWLDPEEQPEPTPTPEAVELTPQEPEKPPHERSTAFVFKPELRANVTAWLQKNWFFAVAAVSFALAGIFLVQYGVEKGLLSPALRVTGAIVLGLILVGAGEFVRRKLGGDEEGSFALLPSAFSGAGLVSMFAGILAARTMYGLIGAEVAFVGLAMTGVLAVVLGWFYGPLLAIVGVFGALAAPFLVGGDSDVSHFLHFYFAGIAAVALTIDAIKRWAWLSALGLIGAYGASGLLQLGNGFELYFVAFALITAGLSVAIPVRRLIPDHSGPRISQTPIGKAQAGHKHSEFPTRIAAGAFIASTAFVGMAYLGEPSIFWLALTSLVILLIGAVFWMHSAIALRDLAYLPAAAGLAIIVVDGISGGVVQQSWIDDRARPELDFASPIMAVLLVGALLTSLAFAWRSAQNKELRLPDAGVGAAFAPLVAVAAEMFWEPSYVLGSGNWAIYLAVIAIAMTVLAERFAKKDGEDRLRTAMFALSAISMLSFVLIVMLGSFALTLALAVMVAAAAWMGRQFNLPLFDRYVQVGVVVVSWRLVLDPGLFWAFEAPLWQVFAAYAGAILLFVAAYFAKRPTALKGVGVMLESAIWSLAGIFASLLLIRYFDAQPEQSEFVVVSLVGLIWLISAANQFYRLRSGPELRRLRIVLGSIYSVAGVGFLGVSVFPLNPLADYSSPVTGPLIVDGLAAAYLLPAMLLTVAGLRFRHLPILMRRVVGGAGVLLGALYVGLEIRRWWQGDDLSVSGVLDGELYSYTIAMMLAAIALLVLAFVRQSAVLRKLALVAIGLTVAKVYLIDMSGLDGLLRVVSFLVLAMVLAAMAWVNRILQNNENAQRD